MASLRSGRQIGADGEFIGLNETERYLGNPVANGYILLANTDGTRSWVDPDSVFIAGETDLVIVKQEGTNVGTGGTNSTLDFYGNFALTQSSVGVASIRLADTLNIGGLNVTGVSTFTRTDRIQISVGHIDEGPDTTDGGIKLVGIGTTAPISSGLFTEVDGEILSYGINVGQISTTGFSTDRVGGIFRLDTRTGSNFGDSNNFVVKGRSIGTTVEHNSVVINLDTGETSLSPDKGNVGIGTNLASQSLDVNGNARFRGAIYDNNNVVGSVNNVLVSTGSGVVWADAGNTVGVVTDSDLLDGLDSTQFLRSDVADTKVGVTTFQDDIFLGDDDRLIFGDGNDLQIYHNGSNSLIQHTGTGNLFITNSSNDKDVFIQSDDGSGGTTNYFVADGSTGEVLLGHYGVQKLATKSNGIDVTGHTETDTLNVSGVSTLTSDVIASSTLTVGDTSGITGGAPTNQGVLAVYTSGGKNSLIIQTSDNTQDRGIAFRNSGDAYVGYISIEDAGSSLGDMVFGVSNATESNVNNVDERFRITKDGELGVGTNTPTQTLDINGNARFRGAIYDNNNVVGAANSVLVSTGSGVVWKSPGLAVGIASDADLLDGLDSTQFVRSDVFDRKTSGSLRFDDSVQAQFGTDGELQIFHNGTDTYIDQTGTGHLYIRNTVDDANVVIQSDDGSGNTTPYFRADGSTGQVKLYQYGVEKFQTTADGVLVNPNVGLGTTAGNADASQDLVSFETTVSNTSKLRIIEERDVNGTDWTSAYTRIQKTIDVTDMGYIQFNGDGNNYGMEFGTQGDEKFAVFKRNAEVELYYDNSKKFETTSEGINVTGTASVNNKKLVSQKDAIAYSIALG